VSGFPLDSDGPQPQLPARVPQPPLTPAPLIEYLRDATTHYTENVTDEALVGAVQNWLDQYREPAYVRYGVQGQRLLDDLKRFAEAGI
jgi:hypothetical protein